MRYFLMRLRYLFFEFLICYLLINGSGVKAEIKETHAIIGEWVATERLISEEETEWEKEKSSLLDLQQALNAEISELDGKLAAFAVFLSACAIVAPCC